MEVDYRQEILRIDIGSRIEVDVDGATFSGVLEEVGESGILMYWRIFEFQVVNGKTRDELVTKHQFIPYEEMKCFAWVK